MENLVSGDQHEIADDKNRNEYSDEEVAKESFHERRHSPLSSFLSCEGEGERISKLSNLDLCSIEIEPNKHSVRKDLFDPAGIRIDREDIRQQLEGIFLEAENKVEFQLSTKNIISKENETKDNWTSDSEVDSSESSLSNEEEEKEKSDREFTSFVKAFTVAYGLEKELVFDSQIIFDNQCFPDALTLFDFSPIPSLLPELLNLSILPPRVEDYLNKNDMEAYFRLIIGDKKSAYKYEETLRDRVLFLFRTIKASQLEYFSMDNMDDGMDLCRYSDRLTIWEQSLIEFLSFHSSFLKKISIKTARRFIPGKFKEQKYLFEDNTFSNLKELSLVFWEREIVSTSQCHLSEYWSDLFSSRAKYGQLNKLVWMSQESFSWEEMISPVIQNNRFTLETLHIVCMGDENPEKNSGTHLVIDGSQFTEMIGLKSFYLKRSRCYLTNLELLPNKIEELCLDLVCLGTSDLIKGIEKLGKLKKLRLVDNLPVWGDTPEEGFDLSISYGVNDEAFRVITELRNLDYLSILGHQILVHRPFQEQPAEIQEKNESTFTKVEKFVKKFASKSKAMQKKKSINQNDVPRPTLAEILCKIGLVNDEQIIIAANSSFQY